MTKIFVFGSNREGRHGKGAALEALQNWGAIYGIGEGLQGYSYAIPTKSTPYKSLQLEEIRSHVNNFINFACNNPQLQFILTPIGCGLAGFTPKHIAPLFNSVPSNVIIPEEFTPFLLMQT